MNAIPKHVAIIMDGNGRWALQRGLPRLAGHQAGINGVKEAISVCLDKKIECLTLFAFSLDNWGRSQEEVLGLFNKIFKKALADNLSELISNNIQLRVIGDLSKTAAGFREKISEFQELTCGNTGLKLTVALSYSGRWDIIEAVRKLGKQLEENKITINDFTEETFGSYTSLGKLPDVDLLIRTSGEQRLSNFILWQVAYSEFYFAKVLWPDFDRVQFEKALVSYGTRHRRFGKC